MKDIIMSMIAQAEKTTDYILIDAVKQIIYEFALTWNAPSNWRSIGEELMEEYKNNDWVYNNLSLWEYEED